MSNYADRVKSKTGKRIMSPDERRELQEVQNKETRAWAEKNKVGTQPSTFPEK